MTCNKLNDIASFKEQLKKYSLKATPQRMAVHKAMLKLGHASTDMVAEEIMKDENVHVTVASIYNILSSLSDLGIYERRLSSTNKMFFDVNNFRHAHLYDSVNDVYKDVLDEDLQALVNDHVSRRKFPGYKVDRVDIQIIAHPNTRRRKA